MAKQSGMTLNGADVLLKEMKAFGPTVAERGGVAGVRKAATYMRRHMRNAAPRGDSGMLRRSIKYKKVRTEKGSVAYRAGLLTRQYYSVLYKGRKPYTKKSGVGYAGSPATHKDFIGRIISAEKDEAARLIIRETRKALYTEAGKVYARTRMRRR